MCALTYIPFGEKDFFFTTNRDESPRREALLPERHRLYGSLAVFPKDKATQGTWMLCHEKRFSVCLLNGAFEKHDYRPPYKKSRGIVVLELTKYDSVLDFISTYNFKGIEPFTIVVLGYESQRRLEEIRWDGSSIHYRDLNADLAGIWSSSVLYNLEAREMRSGWFEKWLQQKDFSKESILEFHRTAGKENTRNALVMNRNGAVKTLSITQIAKTGSQVSMYYEDLQKSKTEEIVL